MYADKEPRTKLVRRSPTKKEKQKAKEVKERVATTGRRGKVTTSLGTGYIQNAKGNRILDPSVSSSFRTKEDQKRSGLTPFTHTEVNQFHPTDPFRKAQERLKQQMERDKKERDSSNLLKTFKPTKASIGNESNPCIPRPLSKRQ